MIPGLILQNRQRRTHVQLPALRRFAQCALKAVLSLPPELADVLSKIEEISIVLISDRAMARFHLDFMGIPGPTDVLTFEHGEILISTETAARYALEFAHTAQEEIALYILHGLLHLHGLDDIAPPDRKKMHRIQDRIFAEIRSELAL